MTLFVSLGIRPVINAFGTLTRYGGSIMHPEVLEAMRQASQEFIDLNDAQQKVGAQVARMLGVPAAYICAGASAGILAATAACLAGTDPSRIHALPSVIGPRHEVIIHRSHRNDYDQAVRAAGATFVEIGSARRTLSWELETAITPATAAIIYFQAFAGSASLPLTTVVEIGRRHAVPVIVDAAAELPPCGNLRHFTDAGADLAIFSGGKDIRGPQTTGLVVGRPDLIAAIAMNANPNASIGRSSKVGKEELAGFLRALELYLSEDQDERMRNWEAQVALIIAELSVIQGIRVFRKSPADNDVQPAHIPRAYLEFLHDDPAGTRARLVEQLWSGEPAIAVGEWDRGLAINPQTLRPGEEMAVAKAIRHHLLLAGSQT